MVWNSDRRTCEAHQLPSSCPANRQYKYETDRKTSTKIGYSNWKSWRRNYKSSITPRSDYLKNKQKLISFVRPVCWNYEKSRTNLRNRTRGPGVRNLCRMQTAAQSTGSSVLLASSAVRRWPSLRPNEQTTTLWIPNEYDEFSERPVMDRVFWRLKSKFWNLNFRLDALYSRLGNPNKPDRGQCIKRSWCTSPVQQCVTRRSKHGPSPAKQGDFGEVRVENGQHDDQLSKLTKFINLFLACSEPNRWIHSMNKLDEYLRAQIFTCLDAFG